MRAVHFIILICLVITSLHGQLTFPKASPKASLSQTIGISTIGIDYHRPAVKSREIWGKLVPFDKVWRAGANDNTVISFSHDFSINGTMLKAGKYGLHMIPTLNEWTIILSNNSSSWGSYSYKEEEDALRLKSSTKESSFQEFLQFSVLPLNNDSARIVLNWEKLEISFMVVFDSKSNVMSYLNETLANNEDAKNYNQAAQYLLQSNMEMKQANDWIDKSIKLEETDENLSIKARILLKQNKKKEAKKLLEKALKMTKNERLKTQIENLLKENK
jgi:tetratricopeptide (TPR) repeat protein